MGVGVAVSRRGYDWGVISVSGCEYDGDWVSLGGVSVGVSGCE